LIWSGKEDLVMAGRKMAVLVVSEAERLELTLLSSRRKTAQALALRARIVLECAQGLENREVAARLRVAKGTVGKWRRRFVEHRLDGLRDDPRSGAPRTIEDAHIEAVIVKTLESVPENATHWTADSAPKADARPTHDGNMREGMLELHTFNPARFITTLKRPATTPSARTLAAQIRTSQPTL